MSDDSPPAGPTPQAQWQKPVLWVVLGLAALLLLGSLTGSGTGMFGWGLMMSMMWLWMLVPVLLIVLVVVLVLRLQERRP